MCILALSWQQLASLPMVLAANRDEFFQRPARPAQVWPEDANLIGGQDLEAGGSWLLASTEGRWAVVTNFRDGRNLGAGDLSRGQLVLAGVQKNLSQLPRWLAENAHKFAGFNLLWGTSEQAWYFTNQTLLQGQNSQPKAQELPPGLYVLSNGSLTSNWPKTARLQAKMASWQAQAGCHPQQLFATLADTQQAAFKDLPNTHIAKPIEQLLSSIYIQPQLLGTQLYGTRTSTLVWKEAKGDWHFHERNFTPQMQISDEQQFSW